ncbi:MAG TPA: FMN-binding negative transcriptional regulator [Usitatibacter sp.]|nr:FMN-binding negative transcriptional regulator [Usitatibacter sp.]
MTLYVPAHFRVEDRAMLVEFMRRNAFAAVVSADGAGLHASHLPLLADIVGDKVMLRGHFARANPHWESIDGKDALAIFTGPHAYVSPTWYVTHPSVPTWNYTAVHATGKVRLTDEAELHEIVSELSAFYEAGNDPPWKLSGQPAAYVTSMLGAIVGFEIEVARLEGKFKLSQNRPVEIPGVAERLEASGEKALARLMREHAPAAKG